MKCQNLVVFKGIEERPAGVFKNEKGQEIKYDKSYLVRFDEETEDGCEERQVKFKGSNVALFTKFKALKVYDKINVTFEVVFQKAGCRLEIVDFTK